MDKFDFVVAGHQFFGRRFDFLSPKKHLTTALCQQAGGNAQQGAFSRPTFADDGDQLPFGQVQGKVVQGGLSVVSFGNGTERKIGHSDIR